MATESHSSRRCRLSVAMIVRDEADVLAASIQSVRPIADEIVVLDTGSRDQTPAIAEQHGATVRRGLWTADFSAARNRLMTEAAGEWVLWLDAGERVTAESAGRLRQFLDDAADPRKVYLLMVEAPSADPAASNEQAAQPRLTPRHAQLRFTGRVRETLWPAIEAAGLESDVAPGRILRHRRQHDADRKVRKAQRDLKLVALEASETDGPQPRLLIALGEACSNLDDQATARRAFFQAVRCAPRGSTEMLEAYYGLLSTFDGDEPQQDRQLPICLEALEIYPLDAQLLCATGNYLQSQNRLDLAARAFETAARYGRVDPRTWHLCEIAEMAAVFLSLTLQIQGRDDEAERALEEALAAREDSVRLKRHLIDLCCKRDRAEEAIRLADSMPLGAEQRGAMRDAIRGACKAAKRDWLAAIGFLQSAYIAGCREPLCLRWLSVTLLTNGQPEAAEPVLQEWLRLEPASAEVRTYLKALESAGPEQEGPPFRPAVESLRDRRIRIDPGTTVLDALPTRVPIICQASSADRVPDARR